MTKKYKVPWTVQLTYEQDVVDEFELKHLWNKENESYCEEASGEFIVEAEDSNVACELMDAAWDQNDSIFLESHQFMSCVTEFEVVESKIVEVDSSTPSDLKKGAHSNPSLICVNVLKKG